MSYINYMRIHNVDLEDGDNDDFDVLDHLDGIKKMLNNPDFIRHLYVTDENFSTNTHRQWKSVKRELETLYEMIVGAEE